MVAAAALASRERFDVSVETLRTTNGLRGASVAPGRHLRLPAGYRDLGATREPALPARQRSSFDNPPPVGQTLPPPRAASAALPSGPQPYTPSRTSRPPPGPAYTPNGNGGSAATASPLVSDAQVMQMGRGLFQWPVRGQVLSGFGDKGTGQRNDGLNIRAITGDPVRAAASGDVVYAGDQVPGFGNLVLIKHADGWVTAYATSRRLRCACSRRWPRAADRRSRFHRRRQRAATAGRRPEPAGQARPVDPHWCSK